MQLFRRTAYYNLEKPQFQGSSIIFSFRRTCDAFGYPTVLFNRDHKFRREDERRKSFETPSIVLCVADERKDGGGGRIARGKK